MIVDIQVNLKNFSNLKSFLRLNYFLIFLALYGATSPNQHNLANNRIHPSKFLISNKSSTGLEHTSTSLSLTPLTNFNNPSKNSIA